MDLASIGAYLILSAVVLAGMVFTLFGLPGNALILAAAVGYGWWEGFVRLDWYFLLLLAGLFAIGEAGELAASLVGARQAGGSGLAMMAGWLGGVTGAVAGSFILPLVGTVAGAVAGAFALSYLAEYSKTNDEDHSLRVACGAAAGLLAGTLFKLAVAAAMAVALAWWLASG